MPATHSESSFHNDTKTASHNKNEQSSLCQHEHSSQLPQQQQEQQHRQLPLMPNLHHQPPHQQHQSYSMQCSHNVLPQPFRQQHSRSLPATPRVVSTATTTNIGAHENSNSFSSLGINNVGGSRCTISDDNSNLGVGRICLESLSGNTSTNSSLTVNSSNGAPRENGEDLLASSSFGTKSTAMYSPSSGFAESNSHFSALPSLPYEMLPGFSREQESGKSVFITPSETTSLPNGESCSADSLCSTTLPKINATIEVINHDKLPNGPFNTVPGVQQVSVMDKSSKCNGAEDESLYLTCLENSDCVTGVDTQRPGGGGWNNNTSAISSNQRCNNDKSVNNNDSRPSQSFIKQSQLPQLHVSSIDYSSLPLPCACEASNYEGSSTCCCSGRGDRIMTRQLSEPFIRNKRSGFAHSCSKIGESSSMGRGDLGKSLIGADAETRKNGRVRCPKDTPMEGICEDSSDIGSVPISTDEMSDSDAAPPEVVSLLQEEVLVLQRQCSGLRQELHHSRLLCAQLSAQLEETQYSQPPGYVAEIVGELHAAQKIRDEALMARIKLANEERDAVFKAYAPRQTTASHNTSAMMSTGPLSEQKTGRGSVSAPHSLVARGNTDHHGEVHSSSPNSFNAPSDASRVSETSHNLCAEGSRNATRCQSEAVSAIQRQSVPSDGDRRALDASAPGFNPLLVACTPYVTESSTIIDFSESLFGVHSSSTKSSVGTLTSTPRLQMIPGDQLSKRDSAEASSVMLPSLIAGFTPTVPCTPASSCNKCSSRLYHESPRLTDGGRALSAFEIYAKLKSEEKYRSNVLIELGLQRLGIHPSATQGVNCAASSNQGQHSTQQQDHALRSIPLPPGYTLQQITLQQQNSGSSYGNNQIVKDQGTSVVWAIVPANNDKNTYDNDAQQRRTNLVDGDPASLDLPPTKLKYDEDFSPSPRLGIGHQRPLAFPRGASACCQHTAIDSATIASDQRHHDHRQLRQDDNKCQECEVTARAKKPSDDQSFSITPATPFIDGILHSDDVKTKKVTLAEGYSPLSGHSVTTRPKPARPSLLHPLMLIQENSDALTPSRNKYSEEKECSERSQHRVGGKLTTLIEARDVMRRDEGRYEDVREGGNMLKMLQLSLYGSSANEHSGSGDARTRCHDTTTPNRCDDGDRLRERNDTIELDSEGNYSDNGENEEVEYCMDTFIRKNTLPSRRTDAAPKRTFMPLPRDASKSIDSKLCKHCSNCSKSHDCVGACYYFEGRVDTEDPASDTASSTVINFELFCSNCKEWARANPDVRHQLGFYCEGRQGCEVCCPTAFNNCPDTVDGACTETVSSAAANTSTSNESGSYKKMQAKFSENALVSDQPLQNVTALRQVDECNRITLVGDIIADGGSSLHITDSEDEEQDFAAVVIDSVGSSAASSECSSLLSWRGGSGHSSAVEERCAVATTDARSTQSVQQEKEIMSKFDVCDGNFVESKSNKHDSGHCSGAQIPDKYQGIFVESPTAVNSFYNSSANGDIALDKKQESVFMSVNVDLRMLTQDNMHHCVEKCSAVAEKRSIAPAKPPRKHSSRQRSLVEDGTNSIGSKSTPPPTRPKSCAGEHILNRNSNTAPKETTPDCDDRSLMMQCREVTVQAIVHSLPGSRRNSFSRRRYKPPAASSPILRASPPLSNLFRTVEQENRHCTSKKCFEAQRLLNSTENSPRESLSYPLGLENALEGPESSYQEASLCTSFAHESLTAASSYVMETQSLEKPAIAKANPCGQDTLDVTEFGCFGVLVGAEGINVCDARAVETHLRSNSTRTHYSNTESQKENFAYLGEISIVSCNGDEDSRKTSTLKKSSKLSVKKSSKSVLSAIANLTGRTSSSSKNKSTKSSVGDHQESPQVAVKLSRSNSMPTTPRFLNENSVVVSSPRNSVSSTNTSGAGASIPKSLLVHQALHDGLLRSSTMRETTPSSLQTIKEAIGSLSLEEGFDPRTAYHARSFTTASEITAEHSTSNFETSVGFETSLTSSSAVPQSSLTSSSARVTRSVVIPTSPSLKTSKKRKKKSIRKNCVRMLDVSNTSEDSSYYRRPSSIPVASASSLLTSTSISTASAAKPAAAVSCYYSPAHYYPMPSESSTATGIPLIPYHNLVNTFPSNNFLRVESIPVNTSVVPGLPTNSSASIPSRIPTSINGFSTKPPSNTVFDSELNRYRDIHSSALLNATNINTGSAFPNNMAVPAEHLTNGYFNDSAHRSNVPYYASNPNTDINSGKIYNNNVNSNIPSLESPEQCQTLLPAALSPSHNLDFHHHFQMNTSGLLITPAPYISLPMAPIAAPNTRDDVTTTFTFPCLPHTKHGRSNPSQESQSAALPTNTKVSSRNRQNNSMVSHKSFSRVGEGGGVGVGGSVNPLPPQHRNRSNLEPITSSNSYYLPRNNEELATSDLEINDDKNRPNSRSIATSLSVKSVPIVSSNSNSCLNVHNSHLVASTTVETTLSNSFAPHRLRDVIVSSSSSITQRIQPTPVIESHKGNNSAPVPRSFPRSTEQQQAPISLRNTGGLQVHVEVTASSASNSDVMRSSVTVTQV